MTKPDQKNIKLKKNKKIKKINSGWSVKPAT